MDPVDYSKTPLPTDDGLGPIINCVTKDGKVDDFRSWDDNHETYNMAHRQMDSTGRTRTYMMTAVPRLVIASAGRMAAFKLLAMLAPSKATLALATTEVDMSSIQPGEVCVAKWRGKPVFIANRTEETMRALKKDTGALRDPQTIEERCNPAYPNLQVTIGICTHLGCVPVAGAGHFAGGYFCPCHGSHYDAAGRIRKGPAPLNLEVPEWYVTNGGKTIQLGKERS